MCMARFHVEMCVNMKENTANLNSEKDVVQKLMISFPYGPDRRLCLVPPLNPLMSLRTIGLFTSVKLVALSYTSMED